MKREEVKDFLPVIQAYAEGKVIQIKNHDGSWEDVGVNDLDFCCSPDEYRIKPEEKRRPYESCDEMIADFKKRFGVIIPPYTMPLIWLRNKNTRDVHLLTGFCYGDGGIGTYVHEMFFSFEELFNMFTYTDGTPCGVKENDR